MVDNGVEVFNNMMRVCASEKVSLSLAPLQYILGSKFTIICDGIELDPDNLWAELQI